MQAHVRVHRCVCERDTGVFSFVLWLSPKKHQRERLWHLACALGPGWGLGHFPNPVLKGYCLLRVFMPMQKVSPCLKPAVPGPCGHCLHAYMHTHSVGTQRPSL